MILEYYSLLQKMNIEEDPYYIMHECPKYEDLKVQFLSQLQMLTDDIYN